MKDNRHILLTFDHELFLGVRSGTVEKCLIEPTESLLRIFDEFDVRGAVFFLDTTWLIRLRRENGKLFRDDFEKIRNQVGLLLEKGHFVFPHIHPHWCDAEVFQEREWRLTNLSKYTFKNCDAALQQRLWKESIEILKEFGVEKYHPIDSFRAGGWSIQPFENFQSFFNGYGIQHDFTVLPGTFSWTNAQQYDFTSIQSQKAYRFTTEVTQPDSKGKYWEIPISVRNENAKRSFSERLWLRYQTMKGDHSYGDGQGVIPENVAFHPKNAALDVRMLSIELMHTLNLKAHKRMVDQTEYLHFISHPKMLSPHNLINFKKFLNYASGKFNLDFNFRSFLTE